jgi:hypothetical protein
MLHWVRSLRQSRSAQARRSAPKRVRLGLEALEDRVVPAITSGGGAVLAAPEVQALYYGSDWSSTLSADQGHMEDFLHLIVQGTFMDQLDNYHAGYGVGRGGVDAGYVVPQVIDRSGSTMPVLSDVAVPYGLTPLQAVIQNDVNQHHLQNPDPSKTIYLLFVEPGIEVQMTPLGSTAVQSSKTDFVGYHGSFVGNNANHFPVTIHYAVIPYPGSGNVSLPYLQTNANQPLEYLSSLDQITSTASHEVAEDATDPNNNGWRNWEPLQYSSFSGDEIGDETPNSYAYLEGPGYQRYAIQRLVTQDERAMTPAGSLAGTNVSFVLTDTRHLWRVKGSDKLDITSPVTSLLNDQGYIASISDQGIDLNGQAFIAGVDSRGAAFEVHVDPVNTSSVNVNVVIPANSLPAASSAKAGQALTYVLFTNGSVSSFYQNGMPPHLVSSSSSPASAIDAGTDYRGVNMVVEISSDSSHTATEFVANGAATGLGSNVRSVSAGQQGIIALLYNGGTAYWYSDYSRTWTYLASSVGQVTAGVDPSGHFMFDVLYTYGSLSELRWGGLSMTAYWTNLGINVAYISKARDGVVSKVVMGAIYDYSYYGTTNLGINDPIQIA